MNGTSVGERHQSHAHHGVQVTQSEANRRLSDSERGLEDGSIHCRANNGAVELSFYDGKNEP